MTLNQIIRRTRLLSLAHKQIRNFYFGFPTDFLTNKTTEYASVFLQDLPGTIDLAANERTLAFKLYALDLVHVSEDNKSNELDVQSDMLSIVEDIIAEMNHSSYTDWKISISSQITLLREEFDDLVAGAVADISIVTPYLQDKCVVPTETLPA